MKGGVFLVEGTAMWEDLEIGEILTSTGWLDHKSREERRTERSQLMQALSALL